MTVGNGAGIVNLGMKGDTMAMPTIGDAAQPAIGNSTMYLVRSMPPTSANSPRSIPPAYSTNDALAPKLAGTGTIAQFNGTTILTADFSAFSGQTVVGGGTPGSPAVRSAGRLTCSPTVACGELAQSAIPQVPGTIAPGNSIGTLNVAGNILFNPNSIYEVEANAAGQADKIVATGTATINGGTVKLDLGRGRQLLASATTGTILTANGGRSTARSAVSPRQPRFPRSDAQATIQTTSI